MWRHITNPDILIFLQASYESCTTRRRLNWHPSDYAEQLRRLTHALQHADLIIDTDMISADEVLNRALDFLGNYHS
jgi:hypothetical protein